MNFAARLPTCSAVITVGWAWTAEHIMAERTQGSMERRVIGNVFANAFHGMVTFYRMIIKGDAARAYSFLPWTKIVIPAKAGIQPNSVHSISLVPGLRRDDDVCPG
ncbi:MAG: hypothetical protein FWG73_03625 [Planctomycetaceae bacterium]|nr:hypothetical protein [Planctomycetaceae bacterium]